MTYIPDHAKRRLLPRWRPFAASTADKELNSVATPRKIVVQSEPFLEGKLAEWEDDPSLPIGVDILTSAVALGRTKEFERIGWWVLNHANDLAPAVVNLAKFCVYGGRSQKPSGLESQESAMILLRRARRIVVDNPRDGILHTDIALAHAILGNIEHARRSILIATDVAPNNRFVLRAAVRFWAHVGEPERGRALLLRSDRTPHDPWLIASELAISSYTGKSPRLIKAGRAHLSDRRFNVSQLTELASAVGTIDALDGNRKRARDYFAQSLIKPTENVLAQAIWALRSNVKVDVDVEDFRHLDPHEALTWDARTAQKWPIALAECEKWLNYEGYSKAPAMLGSFIACVVNDNVALHRFATRGFRANPTDPALKNNLAVSEIFQGKFSRARKLIAEISGSTTKPEIKAAYFATSGLADLREGHLERGRAMYAQAIDSCLNFSNKRMVAIAAAFWGREELKLKGGRPELPIKIFEQHAKTDVEPEFAHFHAEFLEARSAGPKL